VASVVWSASTLARWQADRSTRPLAMRNDDASGFATRWRRQRRLLALTDQLRGQTDAVVTAQRPTPPPPPWPPPQPGPGGQGFGPRRILPPPVFEPVQVDEALEFFSREGYCCLAHTLSAMQLWAVHDFMDSSQASDPAAWSIYEQPEAAFRLNNLAGESSMAKAGVKAKMSQVLLETDRLDWCTRLSTLLPFMDRLFGVGNARFAEFNLRETPSNQLPARMGFHHDKVEPSRLTRQPYGAPDWLCTVIYLVDMDQYSPNFAVVPRSNRYDSLEAAKEGLGPEYCEQPIWGVAGTCVVYDTAICECSITHNTRPRCNLDLCLDPLRKITVRWHCSIDHARLDPLEERPPDRGGGIGGRRSLHQWWARGDSTHPARPPSAALQPICKIPSRLCLHESPDVRKFYSLWSDGQVQWAEAGFPPLKRIDSIDDVDRGGNTAYEFTQ
jgi:hypothetical protein